MIKKLSFFSKFMVSHTKQQIIKIDIFLNISRSKSNQTMKFSQLVGYNITNIFLQK